MPSDVPPEFAEAYRAAYVEAIGTPEAPPAPRHLRAPAPRRRVLAAPEVGSELRGLWAETWVKAAAAGLVAIALVLGAYGIGRLLASSSPGASQGGASSGDSSGASATSRPYTGALRPVRPTGVTASCTAAPGVDAGGNRVRYQPRNTLDGDGSTAWRCDGRGVGERLTFALPAGTQVAEVGLVPGYAKTDPVNGVDRYAQNDRITAVRWTIGDRTVVQRLSPDGHDRSLRTVRIPVTQASRVRLQILATARGPRNTVAISTVRIATPRR